MQLLARMSVFGLGMITSTFAIAGSTANESEFGPQNQAREEFYENAITSDSGIKGPAYSEIVAEMNRLTAQYPEFVERFQYGKSIQGRPLIAVKISKRSRKVIPGAQRPTLFIAGSIHGNEYLHIEDRLPRWFIEVGMQKAGVKKFFDDGGVAILAPILNPDGYDQRHRENANGVDLNRDFTVRRKDHFAFKQIETKTLSEFLADQVKENNLRLAVTMDYHCCIGAILHPWSFKTPAPPQVDLDRFAEVGTIFRKVFGAKYKFGTTPKILGYSAVGTSKDYYYETYGAVALTFEGKKNQEDKRFPEHTLLWEKVIAAVNSGKL